MAMIPPASKNSLLRFLTRYGVTKKALAKARAFCTTSEEQIEHLYRFLEVIGTVYEDLKERKLIG
jgi:hypothetical protein